MGYLVGCGYASAGGGSPTTSIDLPVGTEPDDLLVLGLLGGWAGGDPPLASCSDPRMTRIGPLESYGTRDAGVWIGNADSLDPLDIHLEGTFDSVIGQFAVGGLAAYRNRSVVPGSVNWSSLEGEGGGTGEIPNMTGEGSGAIAVLHTSAGIGGTSVNWAPTLYTPDCGADNSYVGVDIAVAMDQPEACPPPVQDTEDGWRVIAFRFLDGEPPVTRLYPRDDALGLGSAPRIHPPPMVSRIYGGLR